MKRISYLRLAAAVTAMMLMAAAPVFGGDIKSRMKNRLPRIIELKAAGIIGENNQGFLAFVGSQRTDVALVEAENKDRKRVYAAIAKQQGTTADLVGQRRAMQLARLAKAGEWIQNAAGQWVQK